MSFYYITYHFGWCDIRGSESIVKSMQALDANDPLGPSRYKKKHAPSPSSPRLK